MNRNLCKTILEMGGEIQPLIIPSTVTGGTGLMNPSILADDGFLRINIRHVNYVLYHAENGQMFSARYGPLTYLNPENDVKLKTNNWLGKVNPETLELYDVAMVDTSRLDVTPKWDFHGLEDARLVRWHGKLFLSGVRRDTTDDGQGRIELSEVKYTDKYKLLPKETSRTRLPAVKEDSYCEKNWMPILDIPFHYVKWTNPTEIVVYDKKKRSTETLLTKDNYIEMEGDLRGGSAVIPFLEGRLALVHEVRLFKNKLDQKDAKYFHRFVYWDKDWNFLNVTPAFSFMDAEIEFSCGLAIFNKDMYITFGYQDNSAYIVRVPEKAINTLIFANE